MQTRRELLKSPGPEPRRPSYRCASHLCPSTPLTTNKQKPQYQYDYDIDGNGAKKWFLLVQSSKTSVEKIKIRKQFIPEDRLCFDRWGDMTRKEKSEYGNVFKNFLEAQIPSFKPQISEKKRK
jgi:hypothetical protein